MCRLTGTLLGAAVLDLVSLQVCVVGLAALAFALDLDVPVWPICIPFVLHTASALVYIHVQRHQSISQQYSMGEMAVLMQDGGGSDIC